MSTIRAELIEAVAVLAVTTGWNLNAPATEAIVSQLAQYDHDAVLVAIRRCMAEHRGQMTLSAIIDRIEDGHPGPESAWALVANIGEGETVVWTDQIARAYGVALPLLREGEQVAARMAFLEAYRMELGKARSTASRPVWFASLGYDAAGRSGPIKRAVEDGKLTAAAAMRMLPAHEWAEEWDPARALTAGTAASPGVAQDVHALIEEVTRKLDASRTHKLIDKIRRDRESEQA